MPAYIFSSLCASPSELTTGTSSAAAVGNANLEGGGGITVQCDSSGNPDSQCVATQATRPLPSANLTHTNNIMDVGETGHLPKGITGKCLRTYYNTILHLPKRLTETNQSQKILVLTLNTRRGHMGLGKKTVIFFGLNLTGS